MDGVCLRATGRVLTMERRGLIIYSRVQKCRRQESMQGTFSRSKVTSEKMGVDADLLVQQTTSRRVKDKSAVAVAPDGHGDGAGAAPDGIGDGAGAAPDGHGGGVGAAPPVDTYKTLIVYPPPQRFKLNLKEYVIVNEEFEGFVRKFTKSGFWLVPHVKEGDKGRPDGMTEPLVDELKDSGDFENLYRDMTPIPDINYCREHVDFQAKYENTYEIKFEFLKMILDHAEHMDYNFALRMQGLLNCSLNAVWTCTEFGFDNADRSYIMEQFLQKYIGRFLAQVSQKQEDMDPDKIVREALQMHSRFSSGWTKEHKKGLAPTLDACSEALVGHFCGGALKHLVDLGFSRKEIARFLRRDERLAPQFGMCLHFFMVKLDQDKNGRNANYKSMFNSTASQLLQMKALDEFLRANAAYIQENYYEDYMQFTEEARVFHPSFCDWYYIVSQLHVPTVQYSGVKRNRTRMARSGPGVFFQSSYS